MKESVERENAIQLAIEKLREFGGREPPEVRNAYLETSEPSINGVNEDYWVVVFAPVNPANKDNFPSVHVFLDGTTKLPPAHFC